MSTRPTMTRRLAAIGSIVLVLFVLATSVRWWLQDLQRLLVHAPALAVLAAGVWYAITRTGRRRIVGVAIAVVGLVGIVAGVFVQDRDAFVSVILRAIALVAAFPLARYALGRDTRTLRRAPTPGAPVTAATHGVLLINPRSGDGKAGRAGLADAARERGIEPIVLGPDDDLLRLARDAVADGADVIGMAGGDGSQALVASVAGDANIPLVVIPAGTRNHLALDLGLDRDDLIGGLDAFGDAVERTIDLGDVNGAAFVNNVSLGLYATIVRSPAYRDAKVDTTLSAIPSMLGPSATAFDLRYKDADDRDHASAHLIQVSNNPYGTTGGGRTTRPSLDTGRLGVLTLEIGDDRAAAACIAALAAAKPERFDGFRSWSPETFEVDSDAPVDLGLDGEAVSMEPPIVFTVRPKALRVRLPHHAVGRSPAGLSMRLRDALRGVLRVAMGRPAESGAPDVG